MSAPSADFEKALADAARLLRELPRNRHDTHKARGQFERFKAACPDVLPQLVIHAGPASETVDFDILLTTAGAGTLALSWRSDDGVPWAPRHADHWASNFVLTVDGASMSIQSALIYLNGALNARPRVMEGLVNRALMDIAIEQAAVEVSAEEVDAAVDEFRTDQGLFSGAATQQWLDETQLTMDALREMVRDSAIARKFKAGLTASRVGPYFEAHQADFNRMRVLRVDEPSAARAAELADAWRAAGTCPALDAGTPFTDCTARLDTWVASDLPAGFSSAAPGAVVGPVEVDDAHCVGQVLLRFPASLDGETRERIEGLLLDEWLAERRSTADVRWHWV